MKIGIPIHKGLPLYGHLDKKLLAEAFEITHNLEEADIIFFWNTVRETPDLKKVVVFAQESPLTAHRRWIYKNPKSCRIY